MSEEQDDDCPIYLNPEERAEAQKRYNALLKDMVDRAPMGPFIKRDV